MDENGSPSSSLDENEMAMTFIVAQEAPYYERLLAGIGKPFFEMIKHGNMAEIGIRSAKIKDLSALKVVAEHL